MGVIIRLGLALLGGVVAALAWLGSAPAPAAGPYEADAMAAKQRIESWLREQASALHGRATTLAAIPRLAIAVTTDAATCNDFMKNELGFTPLANETFELAQLERGRTTRLVRVPDVELPLDWNRRGPAVMIDGKQLVISEVMPVGERGALAVSWRFPADQIAARAGTVERPVDGGLVVGTVTLPLGKGLDETTAHTRVVPMPLDAPDPARYLAALGPVGRPVAWPLRAAGLAIGIGLALLACVRRRARVTAPVESVPPFSNVAWLAASGTVAYAGAPPSLDLVLPAKSGLAVANGGVIPPEPAAPRDAAIWLADSPVTDGDPSASSVETLAADVSAWLERRPLVAGAMPDSTELVQVLAQLRAGERTVPVAVAIAVARQICTQVTVLGGREISTTNVFVSRAGAISLGNLAAAYRSPASEAFAIGAILYELLSITLAQRTDIPAELDAVVQRAVSADPSERYSCCEELATDLAFVVGAYALEITGAEIAHWLACETLAWSPTLRGWPMLDVTG